MGKIDLDILSPFKDNPAGAPTSSPTGNDDFGSQTFGAGSDATRTPVSVEEVQFADFGQSDGGGLDVMSPAPSALGKAPK